MHKPTHTNINSSKPSVVKCLPAVKRININWKERAKDRGGLRKKILNWFYSLITKAQCQALFCKCNIQLNSPAAIAIAVAKISIQRRVGIHWCFVWFGAGSLDSWLLGSPNGSHVAELMLYKWQLCLNTATRTAIASVTAKTVISNNNQQAQWVN